MEAKVPKPTRRKHERRGLILRPIEADHWYLGSGKAGERFGAADLNPSGDWTVFKMADEPQSRPEWDTQGCAVFATLKAWMMLARFHGFTDFMRDASERYTGVWAGTGPDGTDPHTVAEVSRSVSGMIPGVVMPWTDQTTFDAYYNRSLARQELPLGEEFLDGFELGHEWVFPFGSSQHAEREAGPPPSGAQARHRLRFPRRCVPAPQRASHEAQGRPGHPLGGAPQARWPRHDPRPVRAVREGA